MTKMPLHQMNDVWAKTRLGSVTCAMCSWRGEFYELLAERDTRTLWCPACTSRRWYYNMDGAHDVNDPN